MSLSEEVTRYAIDSIKRIRSAIDKMGGREEFGSAFRGRSRELPELIESIGLLPSLTFSYAKAGKIVYEGVCNLIDTGSINEKALEELDKTKFGYSSYLHEVLYYIEKRMAKDVNHKDPITSFEKIYGKSQIIKQLLMPYLLEVKKLAEALFKPDEG